MIRRRFESGKAGNFFPLSYEKVEKERNEWEGTLTRDTHLLRALRVGTHLLPHGSPHVIFTSPHFPLKFHAKHLFSTPRALI